MRVSSPRPRAISFGKMIVNGVFLFVAKNLKAFQKAVGWFETPWFEFEFRDLLFPQPAVEVRGDPDRA